MQKSIMMIINRKLFIENLPQKSNVYQNGRLFRHAEGRLSPFLS